MVICERKPAPFDLILGAQHAFYTPSVLGCDRKVGVETTVEPHRIANNPIAAEWCPICINAAAYIDDERGNEHERCGKSQSVPGRPMLSRTGPEIAKPSRRQTRMVCRLEHFQEAQHRRRP